MIIRQELGHMKHNLELFEKAKDHRWIVFEAKKGKKNDSVYMLIGQAKFYSIVAKVKKFRAKDIDYNILTLVDLSRSRIRSMGI